MKIAIVLGTRPEILKFVPIIRELESRQIKHKIYFTSQHFSYSMGKSFFEEYNVKISDEYPKKFKREQVTEWLKTKFNEYQPDTVLVQGDTKSALVGALAAIFSGIPVSHVEAGLRSFDFKEPFPEEINRIMIDSISTYLFCPTKQNKKNLAKNPSQKAFVTGNTIIDLIKQYDLPEAKRDKVLITVHRRENWDRMKEICDGIKVLSCRFPEYNFVLVKHANRKLGKVIKDYLKGSSVKLINPQNHRSFIELMNESILLISDSGGVLEEAPFLKVPVLSIRNKTERAEAMKSKTALLCEPNSLVMIYKGIKMLMRNKKIIKKSPFGDGLAAKRIVDILARELR